MGYGTDIQAKLGVDTSSVGTDLAGAKNTFNKWGQEVAASGEAHGANFGGKLVGGLEHKIFGARHLSGALAAALGFNIEKISEGIAAAIVGGSKEGWTEALKLADENAKLIGERMRVGLSPKQLGDSLEKELKRAVDEVNSIHGEKIIGGQDEEGSVIFKEGALNAEQLTKQQDLLKHIKELDLEIAKNKEEQKKQVKETNEEIKKLGEEELSDGNKYEAITKRINDTQLEILKGGLTEAEVAKKRLEISKAVHELALTQKRITDESIREGKKDAEDTAKAQKDKLEKEEKLFRLQKQRFSETKKLQDDQNKLTDRSKLTVGELATLQGGKKDFSLGKSSLDLSFGSNEGLSPEQVANKEKAQKVQQLEQEAEQKRLAGDVAGSETAFGKVGQLRDELVSSGGVKSTEGDKFGELRKQIAEDDKEMNHTLQEIKDVLAGKFVSQ